MNGQPGQGVMQITCSVGPVGSINLRPHRASSPKCLMLTPANTRGAVPPPHVCTIMQCDTMMHTAPPSVHAELLGCVQCGGTAQTDSTDMKFSICLF